VSVAAADRIGGAFACIAWLATAGCAMTSEGLGVPPEGAQTRVTLSWNGTDERSGRMSAVLANGLAFEGPYVVVADGGRVHADLVNAYGEHMQCELRLGQRSSGMHGGGRGECRLVGGGNLVASFPGS
jgi:hypothetical protein